VEAAVVIEEATVAAVDIGLEAVGGVKEAVDIIKSLSLLSLLSLSALQQQQLLLYHL
jgi:hypothetical protein